MSKLVTVYLHLETPDEHHPHRKTTASLWCWLRRLPPADIATLRPAPTHLHGALLIAEKLPIAHIDPVLGNLVAVLKALADDVHVISDAEVQKCT
jgi:hypothetical protein